MIIGFTQRKQTVFENPFKNDFIRRLITVSTKRRSEIEHRMLYRVLSSTATVVPLDVMRFTNEDARFGTGDFLEQMVSLPPGENLITPLITDIKNDYVPEVVECFSIRIFPIKIPGLRESFRCDSTLGFFCKHTICIEENDGKKFMGILFFVIGLLS